MDVLECTVMPYAWGSRTAIAELTGRPVPSPEPEAELWMGAHPLACSEVVRDGARIPLARAIEAEPSRQLGEDVVRMFGARLPYLLKVLAAAEPLSIQAHPNMNQARAGFAAEEQRGIARDAPHRNYKDASHKPELLCALTPFDALCGFRAIEDTLALFDVLAVSELDDALAPLRGSREPAGLAETFRRIMTTPADRRESLVRAVVRACQTRSEDRFARERGWALRLVDLYPGDVGIVSALLLNLLHLAPGEAVYLDEGNLHAYLEGTGIEIMASSDNVLRGGLTKKHVDVPELMRVLEFTPGPVSPVTARAVDDVERVYATPAREFRLSVLDLASRRATTRIARGPEILLATRGSATATGADGATVELERGRPVFVPASEGNYRVSAGEGGATVFRAAVGLP